MEITAVQWLQNLSVWSFLPQSKVMQVRLIGDSVKVGVANDSHHFLTHQILQ